MTEGAHGFAVGTVAPAPPPGRDLAAATPPLVAIGRWVAMLGALALLGALIGPLVFGPAAAEAPSGLLSASIGAMAAGEAAAFGARAGQVGAGSGWLAGAIALLPTAVGRLATLELLLAALLAAVVAFQARGARHRRWPRYVGIGCVLLAILAGGLLSHGAAATSWRGLALGAELLHRLGVALWVAGLAYFASLFWRSFRPVAPAAALVQAIPAFSVLATVAVGSLGLSGLYLARLHLASAGDLIGTAYGRWLLAKLLVMAAMLGLGGYHQFRVHPRAVEAAGRASARGERVARRFRRTLRLEAGLGVLALLLAALLGTTSPSHGPAPVAAFRHEREVDDARVSVEVASLSPGRNTIRVAVTDRAGRPLADATAALVQLTPPHAHGGPLVLTLSRASAGSFVTMEALLGMEGTWSGRVVVQRDGAYDLNDRFTLRLAGAVPAGHHRSLAAGPPAPLDLPMAIAAVAIVTLTAGLLRRSRRALSGAPVVLEPLDPGSGRNAGQEVS